MSENKEILEKIEECKFYNETDTCSECSIDEFGVCSWKHKIEYPNIVGTGTCYYEKLQTLQETNQTQADRIKALENKIVYYDENKNPIFENSLCSYTFDCDRGGLEYPCPVGCECTIAMPVKYDVELGKYGLYREKDKEWFYFDEIDDFNKLQAL